MLCPADFYDPFSSSIRYMESVFQCLTDCHNLSIRKQKYFKMSTHILHQYLTCSEESTMFVAQFVALSPSSLPQDIIP